ncbi:hypothetical protein PVAP13_2KG325100 [Panicum virgatum]|uniref:Uncharacterized protein n=1 Tax=Panicum virgatum TaxID=38727 RepID=A0A8T0W6R7_PANVG|nr:hypothetical protein PVAP13_2KG325100 [Panicum virgatum]
MAAHHLCSPLDEPSMGSGVHSRQRTRPVVSPAQAAAGAPGRRWVIAVWVVAREAGSKPHASSGTVAPEAGGELRAGRGRSRGNETRGLGVKFLNVAMHG